MAEINHGSKLPVLKAMPGERVDILSFVVTKAGWKSLKTRIGISQSNAIRILTQLIYKSALNPIKEVRGDWRHLPNNHAKVILYRKQKVAVLGSFNLTDPSLSHNVECFHQVDDDDYDKLADAFDEYWKAAKQDECAIQTRHTIAQAIADTLDDGEKEAIVQDAPECQTEPTDGPRKPWSFQEGIIQQVMAWLDIAGDADLGRIVHLPTGAGKTLVAAEVIRKLLEKKPRARILWVCHRVELVRQSWKGIRRQLNGSIPDATWFVPQHIKDESSVRDKKEFRSSKSRQVVFCTQGMLPHLLRHNREERFDLTVVDECHRFHRRSKTYRALYKYCNGNNIPRLGLTATPLAHEKRGFGQYWNTKHMFGSGFTPVILVRDGFLSRFHHRLTRRWPTGFTFVCKKEHAGPEHVESELVIRIKEFNDPKVNHAVEMAWQQYRCQRQRILCFAVTIDHAKKLKSKYFANDDAVQVVHSEMTTQAQRTNLEWFKDSDASESRMLISVLMLAEGIDLPKTDCLFMVRPTFSPELYQQVIGRGLRGPRAEGTEDCAIVDFTSQYVDRNRQVLPFEQVTTKLDGDVMTEENGTVPEEDEEPDDLDASGRIWTVRDLREAVADLQDEKHLTIMDACKELAQELDYTARTLVNYYHTKADDYRLGWEDPEAEPIEQSDDGDPATGRATEVNGQRADTCQASANGPAASKRYVTKNKLLDLRALNLQRFEKIASLTNVASSTLRSYCSDQENFRCWRTNNRDKMDQVLVILEESLARDSDAA